MQPLTETHPEILEHVKSLLDQGLTKSAVARELNISRDRLRTLMKMHGLDLTYSRPIPISEEAVKAVVDLVLTGVSWKDAEQQLGIPNGQARIHAKTYGYKVSEIVSIGRSHAWDGRVYGSWRILPGTTGIHRSHFVEAQCVCGKRAVLNKSNLLSGASQSCGCIGLKKNTTGDMSQHYQWTCLETGEIVPTTLELSRRLQLKTALLYRRAHLNKIYEDALGYTWQPSLYVKEMPHRRDLMPYIDLIKKQLNNGSSVAALARSLDVDLAHMYRFTQQHNLGISTKGNSLFKSDDVKLIRTLATQGSTPIELSMQFDVKPNVIYNILSKRTYADV